MARPCPESITLRSTDVDFPPGEVRKTVLVPVLDDLVITSNLTVTQALSNPTPPATNGDQTTATLTILNEDNAVSFRPPSTRRSKILRTASRSLMLSARAAPTTSARWIFSRPPTARPSSARIILRPMAPSLSIRASRSSNPGSHHQQRLGGREQTVGLVLTNAVNTILFSPSNATLTIIDTVAAPGQLYFSATNFVANSGDGNAYLTVLRTNGSSGSVSVITHGSRHGATGSELHRGQRHVDLQHWRCTIRQCRCRW